MHTYFLQLLQNRCWIVSWPALSTPSVCAPFADKPHSIDSLHIKGNTLREGQFAIVKAATHQRTGKECALKIINRPKIFSREDIVENELKIMRKVNHPNIAKLINDFESTDKVIIVMELLQVIYVCTYVCMHMCMHIYVYACVCMHVCMHVCMLYACVICYTMCSSNFTFVKALVSSAVCTYVGSVGPSMLHSTQPPTCNYP